MTKLEKIINEAMTYGELYEAGRASVLWGENRKKFKSQLLDYFESLVKKQEPLNIPGELWDHSIGFNEAKRDLLEALEKERK